MSEQAALLSAIVAHPDEDTPRLAYADWLDENAPDEVPSPAAGPSARAEYVRVQCRLAGRPFDDPEYPELLEREQDLAEWLQARAKDDPSRPALPDELHWYGDFDWGGRGHYRRGFPEEIEFADYEDDPEQNVAIILAALPRAFEACTARTLRLEDAYGEEVAGVVGSPVAARLRGLAVADMAENESVALRGIAASPHLGGLRHLELDSYFDEDDDLKRLARAKGLGSLESLVLGYPQWVGLRALAGARWFRNLRSLRLFTDGRDPFKAVAEFPPMPNLAELVVEGGSPAVAAVRAFAASGSFPRLGRLEFAEASLTPEHVAALARGRWPLRHLRLSTAAVRKAGAEALTGAPFAGSLRVLELNDCDITAGGVRALAGSPKLAGLRHLDLSHNPVGASGLAALAQSEHLRGLRKLALGGCNNPKAPLTAADVVGFLAALEAPELRHLDLGQLPVGVRGARLIAAGGTYANLTRLELHHCGLRENGARALIESGLLPHLAALDLADNGAGKGVAKLADPRFHPRLGHANLAGNRIASSVLARLRKRPGVRF